MFVILTLIFSTGGSLSAGELAGILETGKAAVNSGIRIGFEPQGKEMVELWGRIFRKSGWKAGMMCLRIFLITFCLAGEKYLRGNN